ncbi:MAG: hypothetical protein ACHBN1_04175 [Heteroscytonema crispum UTEX LB 1556]
MTNVISQSAGDRAILFGSIKKVGTINILKPDSSVGAKVTIAPSVHQLPQPRPLPVVLPPRSFPLLLGRREEVKVALDALPYDQSLEFYGSPGIGKTVILRYLAHHPSIVPALRDGIVYYNCTRYQPVSDLLQILFNAFYDSVTPFKLTDIQIREALKDKKALILLDGAKLTREEVQDIINALPNFTFLFASSERQLWGEGHPVGLGGLPLNDAVSLVARELGHSLSSNERPFAETLCTALEGHPLRILQAVALVTQDNLSLAAVVQLVNNNTSNSAWTEQLLSSLKKPQRMILALLAALGANIALAGQRIADLTEIPQIKPVLETLVRRNLVQVEGDRYHLASSLVEELRNSADITSWMEKSVTYFTKLAQESQGIPQSLLEESDAILQTLEWAAEAGRWSDVLSLGKAIEGELAFSGQWGTWENVLQLTLEAARATGNQAAEAFALHQLGTRALSLSEVTKAQSYLNQALHIRELLNDQAGIEVTRHNLQFILNLLNPPLPARKREDESENVVNKNILLLIKFSVAVLLLGLGGIVTRFFWSSFEWEPQASNPDVTTTPVKLTSLSLKPEDITWGTTVQGTVTLNNPAVGDVAVNLKSSNQALAPVQENVTIPAGKKEANFEFSIPKDGSNYPKGATVEIAASDQGITKPTSLTLKPQESAKPELTSLVLKPEDITWGTTVQGTVTLNNPAVDDVVVNLESSDRYLAPVQTNVTIPAGETKGIFEFSIPKDGSNYPKGATVEIAASYNQVSKPASFKLEPYQRLPELKSLSLPEKAYRGETVRGTVTLTTPVPNDKITVNISSDDLYLVPRQIVTIKSGNPTGEFKFQIPEKLRPGEKAEAKDVNITASYGKMRLTEKLTVLVLF